MMLTGFFPFASPTARADPGFNPSTSARPPYVVVVPNGMSCSADQTSRWNGVPASCIGTSKVVRP